MIEIIFLIIILTLLGIGVYREKKYNEHIQRLENKITGVSPLAPEVTPTGKRKEVPNEMASESREETPIADIPMMEFEDREFNIELEGDPETPAEAVARKGQ